jgi:hypothetical protein
MADHEKRYSDREFNLIVKTALDLEKRHPASPEGLLLSDIEAIARETGISVDHVRLAVEQMQEAQNGTPARFWLGSATSLDHQDQVPEHLAPNELERLRQSLPSLAVRSDSKVAADGSLQWKRGVVESMLDGFPLTVQVKDGAQGTEIRAHADLRSTAAGLFLVSGGLGVVLGMKLAFFALLLVGLGNVTLPLGLLTVSAGSLLGLGAFWFLARFGFRWFTQRARTKVADLVARLKAAIPLVGKTPKP